MTVRRTTTNRPGVLRRAAALVLASALATGTSLLVGPVAADASAVDNPDFSLVASVPGPVLTTPTVTVTLTMQNKSIYRGGLLMDLTTPSPEIQGGVAVCDQGVGEIPLSGTAQYLELPDNASGPYLVTTCTVTVTNTPGQHSLTFVLNDDDEVQLGQSVDTVSWVRAGAAPEVNACDGSSVFALRSLNAPTPGPSQIDSVPAGSTPIVGVSTSAVPALPNPPYGNSGAQNGLMIDPVHNRVLHTAPHQGGNDPTLVDLVGYDTNQGGWYVAGTFNIPGSVPTASLPGLAPQRGAFTADGTGYLQTLNYTGGGAAANNLVWKIVSTGTYSYSVTPYTPINGAASPIGGDLAFDAAGIGWVLDQQNANRPRAMKRWDPATSTLTDAFQLTYDGNPVPAPGGGVNSPAGLAFGADGKAYISIGNTASTPSIPGNAIYQVDMATGAMTKYTDSISTTNRTDQYWIDLASCSFPSLSSAVSVGKTLVGESGTVPGVAEPGETLTYRIRLTNTGNTAATLLASEIVETVPAGTTAAGGGDFTCAAGAAAGTSCPSTSTVTVPGNGTPVDLTFAVTVSAPVAGGLGAIANVVAFSGPNAPDCGRDDCVENTPVSAPALTLEKTVDPQSVTAPGQTLTFTYLVTNSGNVPLTSISIVEDQFTGTEFSSGPTCPSDALPVGTPEECTATYVTTQKDIDDGDIVNIAHAVATGPAGEPVRSDTSIARPVVTQSLAIGLAKTVSPDKVVGAGDTVTYSFLVTNLGTATLSGFVVDESSFSGTGTLSDLSCPSATLAPTKAQTCTATYVLTAADITAGVVDNTATVTAHALNDPLGERAVTSNESSAQLVVLKPGVSIVEYIADANPAAPTGLTADGQDSDANTPPGVSLSAPGSQTFSFVVTNTGNTSLDSVTVVDTRLGTVGCPTATLAPGQSMVCTATGVVGTGQYTGVAGVTATPNSGGGPTLPAVSGTDPVYATVAAGATIGDFAWDDLNGNGIQEVNEPGLAGVTVTLTGTDTLGNTVLRSAVTDSNGAYSLTVPPGTYTVTFEPPAGYVPSPAGQGSNPALDSSGPTTTVTVVAGEIQATVDYGAYRPAAVAGTVFVDDDADGVRDPGDAPLAGVKVELLTPGGTVLLSTVTLADGGYAFPDLRPGAYTVRFTTPAGQTATTPVQADVDAPTGGTGRVDAGFRATDEPTDPSSPGPTTPDTTPPSTTPPVDSTTPPSTPPVNPTPSSTTTTAPVTTLSSTTTFPIPGPGKGLSYTGANITGAALLGGLLLAAGLGALLLARRRSSRQH